MILQHPSGFIEPCLPSKVARPPSGPLWVHEIKHDGYRLMVRRDGGHRGGTKKKPPLKVGKRWLIPSIREHRPEPIRCSLQNYFML